MDLYDRQRQYEALQLGQLVFAATVCPVCNGVAYVEDDGIVYEGTNKAKPCQCDPALIVTSQSIADAHGWAGVDRVIQTGTRED